MVFDAKAFNEARDQRKRKAEAYHDRMSKLFKENRFMFEIERKKAVDEAIRKARKRKRAELTALQEGWDSRLKNAGSEHNRFVLAKTFFWDFILNNR